MSTEEQLVGWKVWYYFEDKIHIYSSKKDEWNDIPTNGLQILVKYLQRGDDVVTLVIQGADAYVLTQEQFNEDPKAHCKFGAFIDSEILKEIRKQVVLEK